MFPSCLFPPYIYFSFSLTDCNDINKDLLSGYNINVLQFVLNDFREKIEQHSTELVNLLIQKDELETEQDSMLIDIEDISHSSLM